MPAAISDPGVIARALDASVTGEVAGVGLEKLSRAAQMHRTTIRRLRERYQAVATAVVPAKAAELTAWWSHAFRAIGGALSAKQLRDASALQLITSAGIATDKLLLLSGAPTQIIEHQHTASLDDLRELLVSEITRRKSLGAPQPVVVEADSHVVERAAISEGNGNSAPRKGKRARVKVEFR